MRKLIILRLTLLFLGFFSLAMIIPLAAAIMLGEKEMVRPFAWAIGLALIPALPAFLGGRFQKPPNQALFPGTGENSVPVPRDRFHKKSSLNINAAEGIFLVSAVWVGGSLLGALPYYLSGYIPRYTDAVFESVSGFSTTGATLIPDVEILPLSFHLWRGLTHWLGGMGILALTVALVPLLGVGGFQLLKAETSGPAKEKFTPRISAAAKFLWLIYCGLTLLETLLLALGGMNWFEALIHAFSTMAAGGFSTRNNSVAAYNSDYIQWVCAVFMIIAGFNFTLIHSLFRGKYREVLVNSEGRAYGLVILVSVLIITLSLLPRSESAGKALGYAVFSTASILTTTGFVIADHNLWPPLAQVVLFMLMFCGGCSGSTAGGVKIIRYVILFKQAGKEIKKNLYPSGVFSVTLDRKGANKNVVYSVSGFVALYMFLVLGGTFLVSGAGVDLFDALNASIVCLGNIGLGFGRLTSGTIFLEAPGYVKWGLSFLMIAGRLELYTLILLFMPAYWGK